jgi:hypothetical protein
MLWSRVVRRLRTAEATETDPWLRDDIQIARLTVVYAATGEAVCCSPDVLASYEILGLHPEKVWPAIQARRKALLGPIDVSGAPPKKSAQSVKLWPEKISGARTVNSRAGDEAVLREPTISVPMAAPSLAELYPNSDEQSSGKRRQFSYDELLLIVRKSFAPPSIVRATINALTARGRWPHWDGPVDGTICVSLKGMMLGGPDGDQNCLRSTARWRARRAVKLGYWRLVRRPNSWSNCPKCGAERVLGKCGKFDKADNWVKGCDYEGRSKTPDGKANFNEFCRPYMYEIDIEKFRYAPPAKGLREFNHRAYQDHKRAESRGERSNLVELPRKPSQPADPPRDPAPAAPIPQRQQPAAEHRSSEPESRRILRDEKELLWKEFIAFKRAGRSDEEALADLIEKYQRFPAEEIKFALKVAINKKGNYTPPRPQPEPKCRRCRDQGVIWNQPRGPGQKLIPCPDCRPEEKV